MSKTSLEQMPMGFGFALVKNEPALRSYAALPPQERERVLEEARKMRSKQAMELFVSDLAQRTIQP